MDANCKNNKFNLDHVYCHSNDSNYIRANKSSGAVDLVNLIKENKQLKAMLLLHLDLIQEQSDQLQAKDKLLATLKEENEGLKQKLDKIETEKLNKIGVSTINQENKKTNYGVSGKTPYHRVHGKNVESAETYKKVNKININNKHEDKKENLSEYSNIEHKKNKNTSGNQSGTSCAATITTRSRHTPTPPSQNENKNKTVDDNSNGSGFSNSGSIIGQSNGKPISKIMLQLHRVKIPESGAKTQPDDKSDPEISSFNIQNPTSSDIKIESPKSTVSSPSLLPPVSKSPKWFRKTASPTNLSLTAPLTKKSKISKNILEPKIDLINSPSSPLLDTKTNVEIKDEIKQEDTDDGFSCGSSGPDMEPVRRFMRSKSRQSFGDSSPCSNQQFIGNISPNIVQETQNVSQHTKNIKENNFNSILQSPTNTLIINNENSKTSSVNESGGKRKITFLTTNIMYSAREWTTEAIPADEFTSIKEEEEALKAEQPMLEIPKWTLKEVSHLYSIEGTEDLSDETFRKRHAKLEHDEKRRKKWDVQRIREQRTIERLKRRHCKDELVEPENTEMISFYPPPEQIKFIHITEELPVEAFGGEMIPRLNPCEFQLPWKKHSHSTRMSDSFSSHFDSHNSEIHHHKISLRNSSSTTGIGHENSGYIPKHTAFLFMKRKKKPSTTTTTIVKKQYQRSNTSTLSITNVNNLSSHNLSNNSLISSSKQNNLLSNITSPNKNFDEKNLTTNNIEGFMIKSNNSSNIVNNIEMKKI